MVLENLRKDLEDEMSEDEKSKKGAKSSRVFFFFPFSVFFSYGAIRKTLTLGSRTSLH